MDVELLNANTVRVRLSVQKAAPVSQATVATITSRGLTDRGFAGYVYVALENTGPDTGLLAQKPGKSYPLIATRSSRILTLDSVAAAVTGKIDQFTRLLQDFLDEKTVASLKSSITTLERVTRRMESLLNGETVASFRGSAKSIQELTRTLNSALDPKTVSSTKRSLAALQSLLTNLATNNRRIASLIVNAERDSREIRPALAAGRDTARELNAEVLPELDRSLARLNALTRTMNRLAARMSRDPSVVLRGVVSPPGPGER